MINISYIAEIKDRNAWERMWGQYAPDHSQENTEYLWQRLNTYPSPVRGIFALQQGIVIGFAHYVIQETTSGPKPGCYIQDLYVSPENRHMGVAKEILQWFKQQAATQGWSKVTLKTRTDNLAAQKLYDAVCERRNPHIYYDALRLGQ